MSKYLGPLPVPTPESKPFWAAAKRHRLELPTCRSCGKAHYYPRAICPFCLSGDLEWRVAAGTAVLHTFTVVHRGQKDFPLGTPYIMAVVELAEGPRMMTNIVDLAPDSPRLEIGLPLEVVFQDVSDDIALPHFRPAGGVS